MCKLCCIPNISKSWKCFYSCKTQENKAETEVLCWMYPSGPFRVFQGFWTCGHPSGWHHVFSHWLNCFRDWLKSLKVVAQWDHSTYMLQVPYALLSITSCRPSKRRLDIPTRWWVYHDIVLWVPNYWEHHDQWAELCTYHNTTTSGTCTWGCCII